MPKEITVLHVLRLGEPKCPKCGQGLESEGGSVVPRGQLGRRPAVVAVRGLRRAMGVRMTRTHSEKWGGKWRATTSHAVCDFCGKEDETAHQGRVTAPLPHGWTYSERESASGKSVQMMYSCGCDSTDATLPKQGSE